jgi:hypothetical protein
MVQTIIAIPYIILLLIILFSYSTACWISHLFDGIYADRRRILRKNGFDEDADR